MHEPLSEEVEISRKILEANEQSARRNRELFAEHKLFAVNLMGSPGASKTEIQYTRVVSWNGNETAQQLMQQVFEPCDTEWRGLGTIPQSGIRIRDEFAEHDAAKQFEVELPEPRDNPGCLCGDVLRGVKTPPECKLFAKTCTPSNPIGPCMVASEGTYSAYFKYGRRG